MKKITLLSAILMIAFSANSFAQATATGTSTTTVIAPISITKGADLAFGNVTEDGSVGEWKLIGSIILASTPIISTELPGV